MKRMIFLVTCLALFAPWGKAVAQAQELKQLALNIEKIEPVQVYTEGHEEGYEILTQGYNTVKDLTKGNFDLHKTFLDALLQVSPTVRSYKRVADIVDLQLTMIREYGNHRNRLQTSGLFNGGELAYFNGVYDRLLDASLKNLDELTSVLTAGELRMSDQERLEAIDRIYAAMQEKMLFLRDFNSDTTVLALQRSREANDINAIRTFTGINP